MRIVRQKLLYISSSNRTHGFTYDFGIDMPAQFTKVQNKDNYVAISLVDAEIRASWFNVRSSNNKFYVSNYDKTLDGNYDPNPRQDEGEVKKFISRSPVTYPSEKGWYDTPNNVLCIIKEGNYDIYGLVSQIQDALNTTTGLVNCSANYAPAGYASGMSDPANDLGAGSANWGTDLLWSVIWDGGTGSIKITFEDRSANPHTDMALDFRSSGDYETYAYGTGDYRTPTIRDGRDIESGAYELMGFDRHSIQNNGEGVLIPMPYAAATGDAPTTDDNTLRPLISPNPALIGAPMAIYIHSNLPMENVAAQRDVETSKETGLGISIRNFDKFNGSNILAKIPNLNQWFSAITFQSQGEDDYQLHLRDLKFLNSLRLWITDEHGYRLKTKHDWSLTLKYSEREDETRKTNEENYAKQSVELLKLLLIQGEKNIVIPPPSDKVLDVGNIWKTKKERSEEKAAENVKRQKQQSAGINLPEHKEPEKVRNIEEGLTKKSMFGDKGGLAGAMWDKGKEFFAGTKPAEGGDDGVWVRERTTEGDGMPLFKGEEKHLWSSDGVPYSYAGAGTKYRRRQKLGHRGINKLDALAMHHDSVYANPLATKKEVEVADLQLQQGAAEIAEKYPALSTDARIIKGLFDLKDTGVKYGMVDRMLFTAANNPKNR